MESIGFKDFQIDALEQAIGHNLNYQSKLLHYSLFKYEKCFYHPDKTFVEIKECPYCITNKKIIDHFFKNTQYITINGVAVKTLSLEDTLLYHFINALTNINTSRYGKYDFKLRDLFDTDKAIDILIEDNSFNSIFKLALKYGFEKHVGTAILASSMLLEKPLPNELNSLCQQYNYEDFLRVWDAKTYIKKLLIISESQKSFNNDIKHKTMDARFVSPLEVITMEDCYDFSAGIIPISLCLTPAYLGCEALKNQFKISFLKDKNNFYIVAKSTDELKRIGIEIGILNLSLTQDSKLNNVVKIDYSDHVSKFILNDFKGAKINSYFFENDYEIITSIPIESLINSNSIQFRKDGEYIFFYILITSPKYVSIEKLETKFYYVGLRDCHWPLLLSKH